MDGVGNESTNRVVEYDVSGFCWSFNTFIKSCQVLPQSLILPFSGMRLTLLWEEKDVICYFNRHVRSSSSLHGFICVLIEKLCDFQWIFLLFLMNCLKKGKKQGDKKLSITLVYNVTFCMQIQFTFSAI